MELEFLEWLTEKLPAEETQAVLEDDAASIVWGDRGELVVTTDAITDDVDFHLADVTPAQVGHKALGVNLSDLAAMAAEPVAAFVSLVLPEHPVDGPLGPRTTLQLAQQIYEGILPLAEQFGVAIAGGDTNVWDHPLAISITALGRAGPRGPLRRSGAQPGDELLVTGALGGSLLGRHLAVEPRVSEARLLREQYALHAGIDISDGLALDASRLAAASGCGVEIDVLRVPISDAAKTLAGETGRSPLDHALGDGEDFELLAAAPPEAAAAILADQPLDVPVTRIGWLTAEPGLHQRDAQGVRRPLAATGFRH